MVSLIIVYFDADNNGVPGQIQSNMKSDQLNSEGKTAAQEKQERDNRLVELALENFKLELIGLLPKASFYMK